MGAPWVHLGRTLGAPWAHLGRVLGAPWAHLGRSLGAAWARLGRTWMLRMACGASPGPPPAPRGHAEHPGPMIRIILSIGLRCPTCPLGADGGPRLLPHAMQSIPTVPSSLAPLPRGPGGPVQDGGEITQISERLSARWVHYLEIQRYLSSGHRCSVCGSSVLHPPPQAEYLPSRPPPPTPP